MVPPLPTAHPSVDEERATPYRPSAPAGATTVDQAPVGHAPDHLRMLAVVVLLPTAHPSSPPGKMKTENRSIVVARETVAQDVQSQ
jgi:hypothetical protein